MLAFIASCMGKWDGLFSVNHRPPPHWVLLILWAFILIKSSHLEASWCIQCHQFHQPSTEWIHKPWLVDLIPWQPFWGPKEKIAKLKGTLKSCLRVPTAFHATLIQYLGTQWLIKTGRQFSKNSNDMRKLFLWASQCSLNSLKSESVITIGVYILKFGYEYSWTVSGVCNMSFMCHLWFLNSLKQQKYKEWRINHPGSVVQVQVFEYFLKELGMRKEMKLSILLLL